METIKDFISQIASGLKFLHSQNIIHGDLTPKNILLFEENGKVTCKIADYLRNTITPFLYSAPEILSNDQPMTERSDVWSLGIIIFQLCKLRLPFSQCYQVGQSSVRVTDVPFNIQKIITRCLEVQPKNRITLTNVVRLATRPDRLIVPSFNVPSIPTTITITSLSLEDISDLEIDDEFDE